MSSDTALLPTMPAIVHPATTDRAVIRRIKTEMRQETVHRNADPDLVTATEAYAVFDFEKTYHAYHDPPTTYAMERKTRDGTITIIGRSKTYGLLRRIEGHSYHCAVRISDPNQFVFRVHWDDGTVETLKCWGNNKPGKAWAVALLQHLEQPMTDMPTSVLDEMVTGGEAGPSSIDDLDETEVDLLDLIYPDGWDLEDAAHERAILEMDIRIKTAAQSPQDTQPSGGRGDDQYRRMTYHLWDTPKPRIDEFVDYAVMYGKMSETKALELFY